MYVWSNLARRMVDTMPETLTDLKEGISRVVQQIVEKFHPQKVILFGSYAYGEPHEGSDLDLLVVTPKPPPRIEILDARKRFGDPDVFRRVVLEDISLARS